MFGGVNFLSPSSRFAGPRALAPMGGAAYKRLRYGVLSHLWLYGSGGQSGGLGGESGESGGYKCSRVASRVSRVASRVSRVNVLR